MFVISQPSDQALSWQCGELHCLGRLAYECLSSWSTSKAPGRERYKVLLLQSWENLASQKSHQEPIKDSLMPDNDSSPMWITSVICSKLEVQGQLWGNKSKLQSSGTSDILSPLLGAPKMQLEDRCSQNFSPTERRTSLYSFLKTVSTWIYTRLPTWQRTAGCQ